MEETKEIVICAAVRAKDGTIVRGHRHHDALRTLQTIPGHEGEHPWGDDQGFVTSANRYVTRFQGYTLQMAAGIPSRLKGKEAFMGGELYSEDLY